MMRGLASHVPPSHTDASERLTCDYEANVEEEVTRRQPREDHQSHSHDQLRLGNRAPLLLSLLSQDCTGLEPLAWTRGQVVVVVASDGGDSRRRGGEAGHTRANQGDEGSIEGEGEQIARVEERRDERNRLHGPGVWRRLVGHECRKQWTHQSKLR